MNADLPIEQHQPDHTIRQGAKRRDNRLVQILFSPLTVTLTGLLAFVLANFVLTVPDVVYAFESGWEVWLLQQYGNFIVVYLLAVTIHELGHLVGGRLVGYRFAAISVGPLIITANERRLRLRLNRLWALAGSASSVPPENRQLPTRDLVVIASGPAASFVFAVVIFIFYRKIADWQTAGGWRHNFHDLTGLGLWIAAVMAFVNLLPIRAQQGLQSDGARIRMLIKGGLPAQRWLALHSLHSAILYGQRPRQWPGRWIAHATTPPDGSLDDANGCYLAYLWMIDQEDYEQAGRFLERALEAAQKTSPAFYPHVLLQAVWFEAYHHRNAQRAREWFDQVGQRIGQRSTRRRAESAVLLVEGQYERARTLALDGLQAITDEGDYDTAMGELEAEWFRAIVAEAEVHIRA